MAGSVQFFRNNAGTGSSTLQVWARKLHELLLLAGWTLEYANADAIGTGSAGSPNFDKTPAASASGGVVVYKMPLNGQVTPWFVRLEPNWGGGTSHSYLAVQVGAGQTAGVLSGAGQTIALGNSASAPVNNNAELYVSAHPDAFLVCLTGIASFSWLLSIGRRINLAGETTDDVTISLITATGVTVTGPAGIATEGSCVTRSAQFGEQSAQKLVVFANPGTSATAYTQPNTMNLPAAATGFPLGPYITSGGLASPPRLWLIVADNDSVAGTDQLIMVDGQQRQALAAASSTAMRTGGRLVFLRQ